VHRRALFRSIIVFKSGAKNRFSQWAIPAWRKSQANDTHFLQFLGQGINN
jgi:hypothetical protein